MRRRDFFTKLLGGAAGAAATVAAGGSEREAQAAVPEPRLVWHEDVFEVTRDESSSFVTSRPVASKSLMVLVNGYVLSRGAARDYLSGPGGDGLRVSVMPHLDIVRRGDRIILRYQTPEAPA